ncbi:pentapeptide repeat-containing protein [Maridesulfovibrio sp.]|uniref:pentapeptide repeat-containing protein n=1 Tax=Maridesulfovibrio sp. TaxID=2795000 RepID=UPI002A18879B|nr:pentapeptide repeat-containing protein [Maridesulfovibrio sp.]
MSCCIGAEHSNWCKDYDIVYIDAEGKEYCIFHAPAECKFDVPKGEPYDERNGGEKPALMGAEQFNGLVFDRIDEVLDAGEDEEWDKRDDFADYLLGGWNPRCNFTKTIFPYEIDFDLYFTSGKKPTYFPPINFTKSVFLNYTSFRDINFTGYACFEAVEFYNQAIFIDAKFIEGVNFDGSKIKSYADFTNTIFSKKTSFLSTEFNKSTYFQSATFTNVHFNDAKFKEPVHFNESTFKTSTSFQRTIFYDYSNFEQTNFNDEANFNLALFKEWSYFRGSKFLGETTFAGAISKETILLESINLSNLKFAETNIESFKFIDCNWGEKRFAEIYDQKNQTGNCNDTTLAEIYRRLKRIARESADEEQTSHWHYREKEMTLKSLSDVSLYPIGNILATAVFFIPLCIFFLEMKPMSIFSFGVATSLLGTAIGIAYGDYKKVTDFNKTFTKIYLKFYRFISGYGEEPIRAGVILFGIVILPFIIKFIASLFPGGPSDWLKEAMWYMPLIKINLNDSQGYHYLLKGISVTLITIQAALFGFALRNKLRR